MARARKILRRLRSIRNIHAVTRAMYMISTARFKHSHDRLSAAQPYLKGLLDVAAEALAHRPPGEEPDALQRPGNSEAPWALIVIASRRGLCGSFNNAVAGAAAEHARGGRQAGATISVRSSGHRGQLILEAMGCRVERAYPQFDRMPEEPAVRAIADELMSEFRKGAIRGVEVAYTRFVSTAQQKPTVARLLPLEIAAPCGAGGRGESLPPLFLPDAAAVRRQVVPQAVRARLFEFFLEASVSEHVARMTAMRYASENADDLIHELTVRYNRARQGQITMELSEIMGGRQGVEGT
jgi:F-type H+-transporting ATPase subunit gamma